MNTPTFFPIINSKFDLVDVFDQINLTKLMWDIAKEDSNPVLMDNFANNVPENNVTKLFNEITEFVKSLSIYAKKDASLVFCVENRLRELLRLTNNLFETTLGCKISKEVFEHNYKKSLTNIILH